MSLHDCPNCECDENKEEDSYRVLRGGSWDDDAQDARSACRDFDHPGDRHSDVGFRLLRLPLGTLTPLRSMNFIPIPRKPNTITIGTPNPEDKIWFEIMDAPVTQNQWIQVMGENPSHFKDKPKNPVEMVSYEDVQRFIEKLNEQDPGLQYRLPKEEEWEYACRAGTTTAYSFGDDPKDLKDYSWYSENSEGTTHPVKQKKPNAWGLYDMHGNVWEWTSSKC